MARAQSPGYPNMSLPKAIQAVKKIHEADRRNPIDRAVAAKHIGYSGQSGASDKALASLAHYGLTEKTGKGEIRVSPLAVDILHPDKPEARKAALLAAAFKPNIFADLRDRFGGGHVSEDALKSYLIRENFLDRAINPVTQAYLETCRYLEQEKAFESDGLGGPDEPESPNESDGAATVFGGAKVGDLVQWEVNGALQMEKPMRVRMVSEDGQWIAVEGSETGIPMSQVIVEERGPSLPPAPPRFKVDQPPEADSRMQALAGETEWMRNLVGRDTKVRLLVSGGEMGAKEIGKLIKLLEAQRAVLADDDEE
ncbi:hypothetical protein VE25_06085 [Devosia geojensis]|uniref:Uncharacterized protein n=1 Tax=Devosia geojensis TaxID=443610 RepID=A0A0F5FV10_9HYPH|nr:hypothetical protein [Devosia geojensis]KKB12694.1 hypothetical protein VE25_06085 [Devosia geojensis]